MAGEEQDRWIQEVLGIDAGAPGGGGLSLFATLAGQWQAAEQHAQSEVQKLKAALDTLYEGDPAASAMEQDFQVHVDAIFGRFDGTLAKDVQQAAAAKSDAELGAVKADLRHAVADMISFLEHDSIGLMDSNPLVKVDIAGACEGTLKAMLAALG